MAAKRPGSERRAPVITFLEDRRVLYARNSLEVPEHCVHSVLEIRHFLSDEVGKHDTGSGFVGSGESSSHASSCRRFLDRVGVDSREVTLYAKPSRPLGELDVLAPSTPPGQDRARIPP